MGYKTSGSKSVAAVRAGESCNRKSVRNQYMTRGLPDFFPLLAFCFLNLDAMLRVEETENARVEGRDKGKGRVTVRRGRLWRLERYEADAQSLKGARRVASIQLRGLRLERSILSLATVPDEKVQSMMQW